MISTNKKTVANAVGGKTARACDSCIKKRARWYCAADDAFLCPACDSSVHSANPLARRHERVRLKIASFKSLDLLVSKGINHVSANNFPSWHQGFTRKARTPRHAKSSKANEDSSTNLLVRNSLQVPEVGSDDQISHEENEEDIDQQLLYRVPIFDPFVAELCTTTAANNSISHSSTNSVISSTGGLSGTNNCDHQVNGKGGLLLFSRKEGEKQEEDEESLKGFLASEMDLADFAAGVESLLGRGLEEESSFGMEELGLAIGCKEEKETVHYNLERSDQCTFLVNSGKVKVEEINDQETPEKIAIEEEDRVKECNSNDVNGDMCCEIDLESGGGEAPFELEFDYDDDGSPETCGGNEEEEDDRKVIGMEDERELKDSINGVDDNIGARDKKKKNKKRKSEILLRLDYEAVISAWGSQGGSPWTTGGRPDFDPDECWPDYLGTCGTELPRPYGDHTNGMGGGQPGIAEGGREARVSRYREKRRTRLFSKKIRYEVRKLNAEKRPRMKGRFVKRATFAGPAFPLLDK